MNNFTFQIVELCRQDELNDREIYWIKHYNSFKDGYNQTLGGNEKSKVNREDFMKTHQLPI